MRVESSKAGPFCLVLFSSLELTCIRLQMGLNLTNLGPYGMPTSRLGAKSRILWPIFPPAVKTEEVGSALLYVVPT